MTGARRPPAAAGAAARTPAPAPAPTSGPAGDTTRRLDPAASGAVLDQLRDAHEQITALVEMLRSERSCEEVVERLAVVSTAVDRAGFTVLTAALEQCLVAPRARGDQDVAALRRLLLTYS